MPKNDAQALLRLAETLEKAARELRQLAAGMSETGATQERGTAPKPTTALQEGFLDELRSVERAVAAEKLGKLKNAELGEVLVALGGAKKDKRLKKDLLIERCLWHLFDFKVGHNIIRGTHE